jgi:hypothetical protein
MLIDPETQHLLAHGSVVGLSAALCRRCVLTDVPLSEALQLSRSPLASRHYIDPNDFKNKFRQSLVAPQVDARRAD